MIKTVHCVNPKYLYSFMPYFMRQKFFVRANRNISEDTQRITKHNRPETPKEKRIEEQTKPYMKPDAQKTGTALTLKMPRKPTSKNVVCLCRLLNILANFSNLFLHTGKQCGP